MIDQAIVQLINSGLGSPPIAIGGFNVELPENFQLPSWTWRVISQVSGTTLRSSSGLNMRRLQIDCYGAAAADAFALAQAIDDVLNGFQGTLPPDSTFISSCLSTDVMDFPFDNQRSYRRMLEYEILFAEA